MNSNFVQKYKVEVFLFCTALFVRISYALIIQFLFGSDVFVSYSDGYTYALIARNIAHNFVFSEALHSPELVLDAMRTPGYPAFLALFEFIRAPYIMIIFVQNILAGIIAVLIYRLGLDMFNNRVAGIIAAILFVFDPTAIYWANLLMSDHFAGFFFIVTVYFLWKKSYGWAGLMLGITALIRPVFLYLSPLILILFYFLNKQTISHDNFDNKKNLSSILKQIFLFFFIFFIALFPWMLRNYLHFGTWQISSNGWVAIHVFTSSEFAQRHNAIHTWPEPPSSFYNISNPDEGYIVGANIGPRRQVLYSYEFLNQPFYKQYFFNIVKRYPFDYLVFHSMSSLRTVVKADYGYLMNHVLIPEVPSVGFIKWPFIGFFYTLWYLVCALALSTVCYRRHRFLAIFLLSFPILNALLTGPVGDGSSQGRYNLPFLPFYFLLGAVGAMELRKKLKDFKFKKMLELP